MAKPNLKFKHILFFNFFKILSKKFSKIFNSFYRHKLNSNLIDLIKKNVNIHTVYDVGAYRGGWSNFLKKTSLKNKNFYLFEANIKNEIYLEKLGFKYFISILSDKIKEVKFYSKTHPGDSYYPEQTNFYKKELPSKAEITSTLDEIVKKENLPKPDFIKIDTQGSEIDILKGGRETISNCALIYLECPIINYNLGSPNLSEYIDYLNSINYVPYDVCEVHYLDKVLIQIDILFIKKSILNKIYPNEKMLNILN
tara:strand:+ start:500 stop:1261 length:762 start_codon:yes stop_codon:yes gene_type:complete